LSEPNVVVTVDDRQMGAYAGALRLPLGPHRLKVETNGFLPFERTVNVGAPGSDLIPVDFVPTPETRAAHDRSVRMHRTWGWIGVGAGALLAGGGGVWLLVNQSSKDQAVQDLNQINSKIENNIAPCDTRNGADPAVCNGLAVDAQTAYDDAAAKDVFGYVGIGVGAAVAITGVVLLVTGEPADRFEHRRASRERPLRIALTPGPGQIGTGVSLSF
jgi:hypothetical protein